MLGRIRQQGVVILTRSASEGVRFHVLAGASGWYASMTCNRATLTPLQIGQHLAERTVSPRGTFKSEFQNPKSPSRCDGARAATGFRGTKDDKPVAGIERGTSSRVPHSRLGDHICELSKNCHQPQRGEIRQPRASNAKPWVRINRGTEPQRAQRGEIPSLCIRHDGLAPSGNAVKDFLP